MAPEPRFKRNPNNVNAVQGMVEHLVHQILSHEWLYLSETLRSLVLKNQSTGGTLNAFLYNGSVHSLIQKRFLRGISVKPLHPSLHDEMDQYSSRRSRAERDRRRINASLSVVALKCKTQQQVRDVLPDTLIALVPELAQIERFHDEGYLLQHDPVLMKQYQDTLDLLLDYQANRLIY